MLSNWEDAFLTQRSLWPGLETQLPRCALEGGSGYRGLEPPSTLLRLSLLSLCPPKAVFLNAPQFFPLAQAKKDKTTSHGGSVQSCVRHRQGGGISWGGGGTSSFANVDEYSPAILGISSEGLRSCIWLSADVTQMHGLIKVWIMRFSECRLLLRARHIGLPGSSDGSRGGWGHGGCHQPDGIKSLLRKPGSDIMPL